jgi:phosphopantetheinyl transferase (holo-ACP synthase)
MKGKLIKRKDRWDLYYDKDISMINTIASSEDNPKGKLCLKNCEEIELGYNLKELIEEYTENILRPYASDIKSQKSRILFFGAGVESFKEGFQKALSILGNNKFSEEDILKAYNQGEEDCYKSGAVSEKRNKYIQSLQQTEFDVEIIIETVQTFIAGIQDGFEKKPKLDKNNCFILKRI